MSNAEKEGASEEFHSFEEQSERDEEDEETLIDVLQAGQIFGEISTLTNLRRTCTVTTTAVCHFQTLSQADMLVIKEQFPSLFQSIKNNVY